MLLTYSLASFSLLFGSARIEGCGNRVSTSNLFPQDSTTIITRVPLLQTCFISSDMLYLIFFKYHKLTLIYFVCKETRQGSSIGSKASRMDLHR